MVAVLIFGIFCPLALKGEHDPHPVGFESRHIGSKKPATARVTGFSFQMVPPAGCPRAAGAARFRCVAPLLAYCAGKRLRVSSAPHPVGFESRHIGSKKPAIKSVTGFSFQMVPPAGFEPAISTLKGWRPWPLDDGDSGKEYSRLFCRRVYRWQTGKPPQRCLSLCGGWSVRGGASSRRRGRRARRCRRGV